MTVFRRPDALGWSSGVSHVSINPGSKCKSKSREISLGTASDRVIPTKKRLDKKLDRSERGA